LPNYFCFLQAVEVKPTVDFQTSFIAQFFDRLGVPARFEVDDDHKTTYIVETSRFLHRRQQIEAWFEIVSQDEQVTILKERGRGTGQTV
jgi:hypothetical protein